MLRLKRLNVPGRNKSVLVLGSLAAEHVATLKKKKLLRMGKKEKTWGYDSIGLREIFIICG